MLAATSTI